MQETIIFKPIGYLRSEHTNPDKTPIQPVFAKGFKGEAEIFPEYQEGLKDIEGFSHIYLITHFNKSKAAKLMVRPFLDNTERGVFSTRTPHRPNPIGFSLVRLLKREKNILHLDDVDIIDGTPILDIKPFIQRFDYRQNTHDGWQENVDDATALKRGKRAE
jgi:tRNA-Thr(GGU) m(6)t(6)A37 methyltransferase TsaA